jgi:hypothetical protein
MDLNLLIFKNRSVNVFIDPHNAIWIESLYSQGICIFNETVTF